MTPAIRRNEMLAFLEAGLEDLSVSRTSFKWGIPVPDDPAHVMYVWFDALTNYMTAVGLRRDGPDAARFDEYWPADVHLIGKEIVRQHAIYWPAFLLAADLPLPQQIVSHGWWLMDGAKMSKSKGNVVRPQDYIDRFGLDALRYFVFREMVFGQDANFSDEAIPDALQRRPRERSRQPGQPRDDDGSPLLRRGRAAPGCRAAPRGNREQVLAQSVDALIGSVPTAVRSFQLSAALREIWDVDRRHQPLHRDARALEAGQGGRPARELDTALFVAADTLRVIAELLRPFMPGTAERTLRMLGVEPDARRPGPPWRAARSSRARRFGETSQLFPRIEQSVEELRQMADSTSTAEPGARRRPATLQAAAVRALCRPPAAAAERPHHRSTTS